MGAHWMVPNPLFQHWMVGGVVELANANPICNKKYKAVHIKKILSI